MKDFAFSDAQALGALTSAGVVSSNVFDMELDASDGNIIITDDQLVGTLNLIFPANANQVGGAEGMNIYLRSCDNADMTTSSIDLAVLWVSKAELTTGCVKNVTVCTPLTQKFVGLFYDPVNSTLTNGNTVDAWFDIAPSTVNDSIQKVPQ